MLHALLLGSSPIVGMLDVAVTSVTTLPQCSGRTGCYWKHIKSLINRLKPALFWFHPVSHKGDDTHVDVQGHIYGNAENITQNISFRELKWCLHVAKKPETLRIGSVFSKKPVDVWVWPDCGLHWLCVFIVRRFADNGIGLTLAR